MYRRVRWVTIQAGVMKACMVGIRFFIEKITKKGNHEDIKQKSNRRFGKCVDEYNGILWSAF